MLSTANITMQFGPKPLFENISVKFGEGNRYGLIGANGCGKSTFMKILGGDLEPSAGNVMLDPNERLGKLRQDQFAYEDMRVLDVVHDGPRRNVGGDGRARRDLRRSRTPPTTTTCTPPTSKRSSPNTTATRRKRARASCCWASASRSSSTRVR